MLFNDKSTNLLLAVCDKCQDCMGYERLTKGARQDIQECTIGADCALWPYRLEALDTKINAAVVLK